MRLLLRLLALIVALLVILALAVVLYLRRQPETAAPDACRNRCITWSNGARRPPDATISRPQGTQVKGLRYDWFTALELPFSQQRFAAPEYLARFGFLVDPEQKPTPNNPGNLPVGFARHQNPGSPDTVSGYHLRRLPHR